MKIIAGIDIGNASTETAIGRLQGDGGLTFLGEALVNTTGIKGTKDNLPGIYSSLNKALQNARLQLEDVDLIRINEAAPVIGDVAMETITETIITESTMIGHNPSTPGGIGIGVGISTPIEDLQSLAKGEKAIVLIPKTMGFNESARRINEAMDRGVNIPGAIAENDDGVLINNRLQKVIPIVDEVTLFDNIPKKMLTAVEVAHVGKVVEVLSNPYGIATLFELNSEETKFVVPIARALIGNRSAVVIKTPQGDVKLRSIPAGEITIVGEKNSKQINVDDGAKALMTTLELCQPVQDIVGEAGTNAGGMLERIRHVMANLTDQRHGDVKIKDLLAVDTISPQKVTGGLAGEFSMENAVGVAAMVKADKLQMDRIAKLMEERLQRSVEVGGVEAEMAIKGALTTPGADKPIAILDMGAGSTDASMMTGEGEIKHIHLAGAGNMVTLLIQTELGLDSFELAEDIKKYPLAKAESLFHIRHEDGSVEFFPQPIDPKLFARVIIIKEEEMVPIDKNLSIEKIKFVRKNAKEKVFVTNALRALSQVSLTGDIRGIEHVVLVGGSALDFEIPQLVTDALSQYGVVAGRGNIRGTMGPRNAVATGLVI
ncbi:diol dehydratase reactivase subunit alpha [Irregularibacter muris]|jgi:diol dehydratase reactivase alpha subunit|uniref:Diol dehydratase reactivase subunit alpha n=1 Tax=Irregularibacter muris TaxID=1796619 RepID=A0AAE3KZJ8_9FIRM|nr:diol dehydratase reactivase subunit alpha [Irregularibacter muris]MCR1898397.1 diol dehydratase reactivase subunit alpha [Irregularibacter muris]